MSYMTLVWTLPIFTDVLVVELNLELFQPVIDYESQRPSFRVLKAELRCKRNKRSS